MNPSAEQTSHRFQFDVERAWLILDGRKMLFEKAKSIKQGRNNEKEHKKLKKKKNKQINKDSTIRKWNTFDWIEEEMRKKKTWIFHVQIY